VSPSSNSSPARWSPNEMPNRDHGIGLAACGEDVSGVMGPDTRQREGFDWTPSLAPPHSRESEALSPGSLPLPRARCKRAAGNRCPDASISLLSGTA
jgi:hypothetical protein